MRKNKHWLLTMAAVAGLALSLQADHKPGHGTAGGGDGEQTTPVTITLRGGMADRITGDGFGLYDDGVDGVRALIGSKANRGELFLDLLKLNSSRTLRLDFSECVSAGQCKPPDDFLDVIDVAVFLNAEVNESVDGGMLGMSVGDQVTSPLAIRFNYPADTGPWWLEFDPASRNCQGSDNVTVERTGPNTWEVRAGGIACLNFGRQTGPTEFRGRYNMPFSLTVVKK